MLKDPVREVKGESLDRVYRGGGWDNFDDEISAPYRWYVLTGYCLDAISFRLVRNAKEKVC